MSSHDHNLNPRLASTLRNVYKRFQEDNNDDVLDHEILLQEDGLDFLGVRTDLKTTLDMQNFRCAIATLLHLDGFRMVQVVGDCGLGFTVAGCQQAKKVICSLLIDSNGFVRTDIVLEYGYTAIKHDANWVVNDLIASIPGLSSRTIGNVVHMSISAVESWGCEATGNVGKFVLVYDHKGETAFGSDIWLSDSVMSSTTGDTLVCLEGGPQAFAQAVNVSLEGVAVVIVTGPGMRVEAAQGKFSAACMLKLLSEQLQMYATKDGIKHADKEAIQAKAMQYLESHEDCRPPANLVRYNLVQAALSKLMANPDKLGIIKVEYV